MGRTRGRSKLELQVSEAFVRLREPIYRYAISILDDAAEAEDIAQEAFLRLLSELHKGREIGNVPAWVFRAAHNLAIDRRRRTNRVERLDPDAWQRAPKWTARPGEGMERMIERNEQAEALEAALVLLSPQERRCLDLRAEGLRYREIAEVLEVGISTVESFLARAIRKLAKEVNA